MLLDEAVEDFRGQLEQYLSMIPPAVHGVKMRDLVDKYRGDVIACKEAQDVDNCKCMNALPSCPRQ